MVFGLLFGVEKFYCSITLAVLLIVAGVALASFGEAHFAIVGFLFAVTSVASTGARWTLSQILLHGSRSGEGASGEDPLDPMSMMMFTTPLIACCAMLLAACFEGTALRSTFAEQNTAYALDLLGVFSLQSVMIFGLLFAEYGLVRDTSSLSM